MTEQTPLSLTLPAELEPLVDELSSFLLTRESDSSEDEKVRANVLVQDLLRAMLTKGYGIAPPKLSPEATSEAVRERLNLILARLQSAEGQKHEMATLLDIWSKRSSDEELWRSSPEPYRWMGKRFLSLGAAPMSVEVCRTALQWTQRKPDGTEHLPWELDADLRRKHARALAETANPERAQQILAKLRDEGHHDEETLGLLARTHKDLAFATLDMPGNQNLTRALEAYAQAHQATGGYWTGINVATLATLCNEPERAGQVAGTIRDQCLKKLDECGSDERYWLLATLGEAFLNLGDLKQAEHYYREARKSVRRDHGNLISTRRHARLLLEALGQKSLVDEWLPLPKVMVLVGHMIDHPNRPQERFPLRLEGAVRRAIRECVTNLNGLIGYSSAACGSDILFQEVLRELDGDGYLVLPYNQDEFETDSVRFLPEGDWVNRYRAVLAHATQVVTASPHKMETGSISYDYANLTLHGMATVKSRQLDTELVGVCVWDGRKGDGPGGTASFVSRWSKMGIPLHCIDLSKLPEKNDAVLPVIVGPEPAETSHHDPEDGIEVMSMLFGDAVGFSKLTEGQVRRFVDHFLAPIAKLLETKYVNANTVRNTWGDGLYLVFNNVRDAGCCALDICEMINDNVVNKKWEAVGLPPKLNIRIALHAGPVYRCKDPVTKLDNYTGTHVSRAARLEPKTPEGEVYASEGFAAHAALDNVTEFRCEYVKQLEWAKQYGTFPTYLLRRQAQRSSASS